MSSRRRRQAESSIPPKTLPDQVLPGYDEWGKQSDSFRAAPRKCFVIAIRLLPATGAGSP